MRILIFLMAIGLCACGGSGNSSPALKTITPTPTATPVTLTEYDGNGFGCTVDQASNLAGFNVVCWGSAWPDSTNPVTVLTGQAGNHVIWLGSNGSNFCIADNNNTYCYGPLPGGVPSGTCGPSTEYVNVNPSFCGADAWNLLSTNINSGVQHDSECTQLADVVSCSDQFWTSSITYEFGIN